MTCFLEATSFTTSHILYKTAVIIAVSRWIFAWILRYRTKSSGSTRPLSTSPHIIKQSLSVTAFRDRSPVSDMCAVCLGTFEEDDEIRELRNCSHVFHRDCIDKWIDYECRGGGDEDNHCNCPLCRQPLFSTTPFSDWPTNTEPSWAVERLLYLFGDDMLP